MKNEYEAPSFEVKKIALYADVLRDSTPPPEDPGGGDIDPGPGGFGDDNGW